MNQNGWVSINVEGSPIWRLPLEAIGASNVFKTMIASQMKEGQTQSIILSKDDDSPYSLEIFSKLAVIWMLDGDIFPRSSVVRIRNLRKDELSDLIKFLDKYDACHALWAAVQRCIEAYLDDESLAYKISEFEEKHPNATWANSTIIRLSKDKNLSYYSHLFSLNTTRRLLGTVLENIKK